MRRYRFVQFRFRWTFCNFSSFRLTSTSIEFVILMICKKQTVDANFFIIIPTRKLQRFVVLCTSFYCLLIADWAKTIFVSRWRSRMLFWTQTIIYCFVNRQLFDLFPKDLDLPFFNNSGTCRLDMWKFCDSPLKTSECMSRKRNGHIAEGSLVYEFFYRKASDMTNISQFPLRLNSKIYIDCSASYIHRSVSLYRLVE